MLLLDLLALDVFLNTTVFALPSEREFRRGRPTGRSAAGTEVGLLADRRSEALPPLADRPAALPILLRPADDQPFDGTAQLVATVTRRGVATAAQDITAGEVLRLLDAQGFGPVLVVNRAAW
jgi:hypothetical protein